MHTLLRPPLFDALDGAQRILLAGAGGGFDVFSGLPLYFALQAEGREVWLANLSFTRLRKTTATQVAPHCYRVQATDRLQDEYPYFPEKYLAEWFLTQQQQIGIYAFEKTGVQPLRRAYDHLIRTHDLDAVILVDGGTDSLMFGDEAGLGTPAEDSCSMAAVYQSRAPRQLLVCLGFGIDHFHGVSHYHFLENVATLAAAQAFLGSFSVTNTMAAFEWYREAVDYVHRRMPIRPSIVSHSIVSAIEGAYGDHHRTSRTEGSTLWINPLMALYWCFPLRPVVERMQYFPLIRQTKTMESVAHLIAGFRRELTDIRERQPIPV